MRCLWRRNSRKTATWQKMINIIALPFTRIFVNITAALSRDKGIITHRDIDHVKTEANSKRVVVTRLMYAKGRFTVFVVA